MVLYIGIYIESDWLYHAEWVALSNGQSGSELAEYSALKSHLVGNRNIVVWPISLKKSDYSHSAGSRRHS